MAFIKRSTVTPVNAKIGNKMLKCSSCGQPFVSKAPTSLCQNCSFKNAPLNEDNPEEKSDPDQE